MSTTGQLVREPCGLFRNHRSQDFALFSALLAVACYNNDPPRLTCHSVCFKLYIRCDKAQTQLPFVYVENNEIGREDLLKLVFCLLHLNKLCFPDILQIALNCTYGIFVEYGSEASKHVYQCLSNCLVIFCARNATIKPKLCGTPYRTAVDRF